MDLWNIGGALLGGLFGGDDEETTSTAKTEPWIYAQPWLRENIESGQHLQKFYQDNPFSQGQKDAYGRSFALSDRVRALAPSLITQMSAQPGFDRSNPLVRPKPYDFSAAQAPGGSTGAPTAPIGPNPFAGSWRPPVAAPVAPPAAPGAFDWASGSGGPPNDGVFGSTPGTFQFDPRSYTGGILPALLGRQDPRGVPVSYAGSDSPWGSGGMGGNAAENGGFGGRSAGLGDGAGLW